MESWNAAYVRVEDYLRAHRIHNRLHQSRLIQKILERAARRHEARPALDPTTLAAEETEALMDTLIQATAVPENFPGAPAGFRAAQLPDPQIDVTFLDMFGRAPREAEKAWLPAPQDLDRICCLRHERSVSNDNVVQRDSRIPRISPPSLNASASVWRR